MKSSILLLLLAFGVASVGCSTHSSASPGPIHCSASGGSRTGTLKVYSAEAWLHAQDDTFSYTRTPYQILTPTGHCYMNVVNQRRRASEEPQTVRLPVGEYLVVAEDTHHGKVTVPVTVGGSDTTVVHLDE